MAGCGHNNTHSLALAHTPTHSHTHRYLQAWPSEEGDQRQPSAGRPASCYPTAEDTNIHKPRITNLGGLSFWTPLFWTKIKCLHISSPPPSPPSPRSTHPFIVGGRSVVPMVERDVVALQQSHHQHQVHAAVELGGEEGGGYERRSAHTLLPLRHESTCIQHVHA